MLLFSLDEAEGEQSLDPCERDPFLYSTHTSGGGEQEVPRGTHRETSTSTTKKHRGLFVESAQDITWLVVWKYYMQ